MPVVLIVIWILWIVLVSIAVYKKWTRNNDKFFYFTYAYLFIGFAGFLFFQEIDTASGRYFLIFQNFGIGFGLTIFLQLSVWWFTRKWHRQ